MGDVHHTQSEIKGRSSNYKASPTTIAFLPPEVLRTVFWLGADVNADGDSMLDRSSQFVLQITQVSHSWREIAQGQSGLFTWIDLMWDPDRRSHWLALSGVQPLNIYLHQTHPIPNHWDWSALAHESFRWHSVDVHISEEPRLLEMIHFVMSHELPNLVSLTLADGGEPVTQYDFLDTSPNLPALQSLTIEYLQMNDIAWIGASLTRLTVTGAEFSATEWVTILRTTQSLEMLKIHGDVVLHTDHSWSFITLTKLQNLHISWAEENTLLFVFRTLKCPNLKALSIEMAGPDIMAIVVDYVMHMFNFVSKAALSLAYL